MFNTKISLQENYVHVQLPLCKLYHWNISRYYPVLLHFFFTLKAELQSFPTAPGTVRRLKAGVSEP